MPSADLYSSVVKRIQEEYINILPPDQWKAMVERELQDLNLNVTSRGEPRKSPLEIAINSVLCDILREKVEQVLDTGDWRQQIEAYINKTLQEKMGLV